MAALVLAAGCTSSDTASRQPSPVSTPAISGLPGGEGFNTASGYNSPGETVASPQLPVPASTPVPAPTAGNTSQTVPPASAPQSLSAVPLSSTQAAGSGIELSLDMVAPTTATAQLPGETSGPALRVDVRIKNSGSLAVPVDMVVVNLFDALGRPADQIQDQSLRQFRGMLEPGADEIVQFLFRVPEDQRSSVKIAVIYAGGKPAALFTGSVG